jgi:hypothetical protein
MKEKPYVLGSLLLMMGVVWAYFAKEKTQTPKDVVNFLQAEQMGKLYSMLKIRIQKRPTLKNCRIVSPLSTKTACVIPKSSTQMFFILLLLAAIHAPA